MLVLIRWLMEVSLELGGGGNYENHAVGFWGDSVVYVTTASNLGDTCFGDYVTIRQATQTPDNPGNLFDAFGYGFNSATPPAIGKVADVHCVQFGRPASSCNVVIIKQPRSGTNLRRTHQHLPL